MTAGTTHQRLDRSVRATITGMIINAVLAAGKITAGALGHSQALIADGIESLADIVSSIVVWRGVVVAAVPEDEDHPYGHGKAEAVAAGVVGVLLGSAAIWIAVESLHQIITPHQTPATFTLVVLVVVIVVKELLFRRVLQTGHELENVAVKGDAWHHRSDAITSFAAGVGIVVALAGGPGYEWADDAAALLASLFIAWNGVRIGRPAMDELMDAAAPKEFRNHVSAVAAAVTDVERIEKCIVRRHGYWFYVDLHVEVDPQMTVARSHAIAHEVKDRLRSELPRIRDVLIHIEPSRRSRDTGSA